MNEKVSVVMPTYKRAKFLKRAINSILRQTYSNVELIVIDDNHLDSDYRNETEKIMSEYSGEKNIKYVKNSSNLGGAESRNIGIKNSTGSYITFLDDDDIYLPTKILTQLDYMLEKKLDFSFTDIRIHNLRDELVEYRSHPYVTEFSKEELLKKHIMHHLTPTNTYMIKKERIEEIGGFDNIKMGQEFMLMLKAIEKGMKIGYLPKADAIQYLHDEERISTGKLKIAKEKELYNFKKSYFPILEDKQIKFVKFRHLAVLAVVGLRSRKYFIFLKYILSAFIASPSYFLQELISLRNKKKHLNSRI